MLATAPKPETKPKRTPLRHPLGRDASPAEDQHTPTNRAHLVVCLEHYWAGSLTEKINASHQDAAVGMCLAARMVTLLEVGTSLQMLRIEDWDLPDYEKRILVLEERYRDGLSVGQVRRRRNWSRSTYYRREEDILNRLIDQIFWDLQAGS